MGLTKKSAKKSVIKTWLAALRGQGAKKYKQGTNALHIKGVGKTKDEFCCLGVLCDLAVDAGVIKAPKLKARDWSEGEQFAYGQNNATSLPPTVRKWAGLKDDCGAFVTELGDSNTLAELNDEGTKFKEIAKIIESNPKGLFTKGVKI
jgi:hypothetical protein